MALNAVLPSTPQPRVGALATAVDQRQLRLLTLEQVLDKVAVGKTLVYQMVSSGQFPAPIKFGRASRWVEREIDELIEAQMERRN